MSDASFPGKERRLQIRALNEWTRVAAGKAMPTLDDMRAIDIPGFGDASFVIDVSVDPMQPTFRFVGKDLLEDCPGCGPIETLADVPDLSLLSRLADHYLECVANRAPVGFEAAFDNRQGHAMAYRGILLPISDGGEAIDFVWGVINCKDLADEAEDLPELQAAPVLELAEVGEILAEPVPETPPPPPPTRTRPPRQRAAPPPPARPATGRWTPPERPAKAAPVPAPTSVPAPAPAAIPDAAARLDALLAIDGALGAVLARTADGEALALAGSLGEGELRGQAVGSAALLRAKAKTLRDLGMADGIDDVLITMGTRYHLIRPLGDGQDSNLFILLLINKAKSNLAMAMHQLSKCIDNFN